MVYFVRVTTTVLRVDGMSCGNCSRSVTRALEQLPGVSRAEASLTDMQVVVEHEPGTSSVDLMIHALEEEGYGARRQTAAS